MEGIKWKKINFLQLMSGRRKHGIETQYKIPFICKEK